MTSYVAGQLLDCSKWWTTTMITMRKLMRLRMVRATAVVVQVSRAAFAFSFGSC